jgi:hypothetical protein
VPQGSSGFIVAGLRIIVGVLAHHSIDHGIKRSSVDIVQSAAGLSAFKPDLSPRWRLVFSSESEAQHLECSD